MWVIQGDENTGPPSRMMRPDHKKCPLAAARQSLDQEWSKLSDGEKVLIGGLAGSIRAGLHPQHQTQGLRRTRKNV